jgi:hypothetical protein
VIVIDRLAAGIEPGTATPRRGFVTPWRGGCYSVASLYPPCGNIFFATTEPILLPSCSAA